MWLWRRNWFLLWWESRENILWWRAVKDIHTIVQVLTSYEVSYEVVVDFNA
jgi:hypothetical protein